MSKNELAVTSENFNLQVLAGDMAEAIAEELDGVQIQFDKVKIPSGGGLAFEVPTDDEDNPDIVKELVGVILWHHNINSYWQNEYDGQNNQPDCASNDGKVGVLTETGECRNCQKCHLNQFGSDSKGGRGKACKNMKRIYFLREGEPLPIILTLPPKSLAPFHDYISKKVVLKGMRCYQVITKITLKKDDNDNGIVYSKAAFTAIGKLEDQKLEMAKQYAKNIEMMARNVELTDDDYSMAAPANRTTEPEFRDVSNDADVPFNSQEVPPAAEPEFETVEAVQEELPV